MSLRARAARGVLVNVIYLVGLNLLGLLRAFVAAAILAPEQFGIWGILSVTLVSVLWLKDLGVPDRFIAQDEEDQAAAFHEAFSVQLLVTATLGLVLAAVTPLIALAYGEPEVLVPGLVLATALPALAFQAPVWLHMRALRFERQRAIQAVDPVIGFAVTIGMALAGAGYWAFVAGTVAGAWATAAVAVATSPSRLRWRVDRAVLRKYLSFSWPLFAAGLSGLAVTQAAIFAGDATLGLTGVAALTLALAVWRWSMRIDEAVTQALYPVVARMRHRGDLVTESFRTSNRLTLLVAAPIGAAFACFAPDLVAFGLGDEWSSATVLLQLTGVAAVLNQVAFSWSAYFRSASRTRPLAVGAAINTVAFLVLPIPLLLAAGLVGYGWGILGVTALNVLVRRRALQGLIGPLGLPGLAARAMAPAAVAVCVTLALRAVASGERTLGVAVVELVVFTVVSAAACVALERSLLRETLGYLRVRAAVQT